MKKFIKQIIPLTILIVLVICAYMYYKKTNFNNFMKAEYNMGLSTFERDRDVKCNEQDSYKIINTQYNDAMFYETIEVLPNTPYKVTCKIKTENVESKNINTDSGAHICIENTLEKSDNVIGTTDWKEVEFYFNSKNRTQLNLGFRLGGVEDTCKGTAWFSDFKIESGLNDESKTWNFLCLLFDNVDVDINSKNVKLSLNQEDKDDINVCMRRFKTSMQEMSRGKMKVDYDMYEITTPIKQVSYDSENGYYVSGYNIKDVLDPYIKQGKYDHIFIVFRTGDINQRGAIPVNDWIGLGSMEYRGLGFSNIRLPDDNTNNYIYKYDSRINTFPEEVLVHEFLHTLERNAEEYGYKRPELHSNNEYGYENQKLIGLKDWYQDYMNKEIKTTSGNVGLPQEIYIKKPAKSTDFEYSRELSYFREPDNIIEELNFIVKKIANLFKYSQNNQKVEVNV